MGVTSAGLVSRPKTKVPKLFAPQFQHNTKPPLWEIDSFKLGIISPFAVYQLPY